MTSRHDDARNLFEKLLSIANDVDLLSKEHAFCERRLLSDFPKAFLYIALINAAFKIQ